MFSVTKSELNKTNIKLETIICQWFYSFKCYSMKICEIQPKRTLTPSIEVQILVTQPLQVRKRRNLQQT